MKIFVVGFPLNIKITDQFFFAFLILEFLPLLQCDDINYVSSNLLNPLLLQHFHLFQKSVSLNVQDSDQQFF